MQQIAGFGLTFAASDIGPVLDAKPTKRLEYCDEMAPKKVYLYGLTKLPTVVRGARSRYINYMNAW